MRAVGLFLLAPLVAEFLLGNLPITALSALVLLAPLYGGGAVLIREVVRRTGRGWPSIFVLALAYGVFEEGITTMSLFDPNYAGERLLDNGYIPALGMGAPWTLFVLTLHTVWSISVPIAIMEALAGERRYAPWLGRIGLALAAVLFVLGAVATTLVSVSTYNFVASAPQLIGTVLAVAVLVGVASRLPRRPSTNAAPALPSAVHPVLLGAGALMVTSIFKQLPRDMGPWLYVAVVLVLELGCTALILTWSRHVGWTEAHELALAAGALLTYAWTAFPQTPVMPASPTQDLVGNTIFAVGALVLVVLAARTAQHHAYNPQT
jgi:hypothetical protein